MSCHLQLAYSTSHLSATTTCYTSQLKTPPFIHTHSLPLYKCFLSLCCLQLTCLADPVSVGDISFQRDLSFMSHSVYAKCVEIWVTHPLTYCLVCVLLFFVSSSVCRLLYTHLLRTGISKEDGLRLPWRLAFYNGRIVGIRMSLWGVYSTPSSMWLFLIPWILWTLTVVDGCLIGHWSVAQDNDTICFPLPLLDLTVCRTQCH